MQQNQNFLIRRTNTNRRPWSMYQTLEIYLGSNIEITGKFEYIKFRSEPPEIDQITQNGSANKHLHQYVYSYISKTSQFLPYREENNYSKMTNKQSQTPIKVVLLMLVRRNSCIRRCRHLNRCSACAWCRNSGRICAGPGR